MVITLEYDGWVKYVKISQEQYRRGYIDCAFCTPLDIKIIEKNAIPKKENFYKLTFRPSSYRYKDSYWKST